MAEFAGKSVYNMPFSELRQYSLSLVHITCETPEDDSFFSWFCEEVLCLSKLPQQALFELYNFASEDLSIIKNNIEKCNKEINSIKNAPKKTDHDTLDMKFYKYFIDENIAARDEIVDALTHRIRDEALYASKRRICIEVYVHTPWSFRWHPSLLNPDNFSEIRHKFGRAPVSALEKVEDAFYNNPSEFDRIVTEYYSKYDPINALRKLCAKHHLLAARESILSPALDLIQKKEYALFCSAAVLQVEGMFEDCCLEMGIKKNSILRESITRKLSELQHTEAATPNYAYYAYRFPRLRNTLAHGRLLNPAEVRRAAELLLLDLLDVAEHVAHSPSLTNTMVDLLRNASSQRAIDVIKFGTLFADGAKCPDVFYSLEEKYNEFMDALSNNQEIWAILHEFAKSHDFALLLSIYNLAIFLKENNICKDNCIKLLKNINNNVNSKTKALERDYFWLELDRYDKNLY